MNIYVPLILVGVMLVITLILIPCLYLLLDDFSRWLRKILSWYGLAERSTSELDPDNVLKS